MGTPNEFGTSLVQWKRGKAADDRRVRGVITEPLGILKLLQSLFWMKQGN